MRLTKKIKIDIIELKIHLVKEGIFMQRVEIICPSCGKRYKTITVSDTSRYNQTGICTGCKNRFRYSVEGTRVIVSRG